MKFVAALCVLAAVTATASAVDFEALFAASGIVFADKCGTGFLPLACPAACTSICKLGKCTSGICFSTSSTITCKCYNEADQCSTSTTLTPTTTPQTPSTTAQCS